MNGTRFARTGRCRFIVCIGILVLMVGMVFIVHSSQMQLDETRQQRLQCEQQQEALNERLTSLVEQKFHMEKNHERERNEQMEIKRNLEQRIKGLEEELQKQKLESQMRYDHLQQGYKVLQDEHKDLLTECTKTKKQQLEHATALEKKLQLLRSEFEKEKIDVSSEANMWKEKYNRLANEKADLMSTLETVNTLRSKIRELENSLKEPKEISKPKSNKPLGKMQSTTPSKTEPLKSFKGIEEVSEGVYHVNITINNALQLPNTSGFTTTAIITNNNNVKNSNKGFANTTSGIENKKFVDVLATDQSNRSIILNSVENFQIVPKPLVSNVGKMKDIISSSPASKSEQQMPSGVLGFNATTAKSSLISSGNLNSNSSPLAMPPNQKKLPDNVAPIPESFETLLEKSNADEIKQANKQGNDGGRVNGNTENNNNRYSNVVNTMDIPKTQAVKKSGSNKEYDLVAGNENRNHENGHEDNLNDNENQKDDHKKVPIGPINADEKLKDGENDDEEIAVGLGADNEGDMMAGLGGGFAAGDIAVKLNKQQLLKTDNLNNEVAADQGKEFGDGLRIDEGDLDYGDDDDYSNPGARNKHDGQAIRN
uniref:Golgi integral membrane protein 4 n=1 Tax=Glossina brevipalpis TaxID=37001 RepID=A0A1A9WDE0_9MUSC